MMEGGVAPNVGEVTSTGSQGYQPEQMNLRSVFTAEQQRILQRYYENGMTNQSKSCFQLILQCAQETKLDFSVVRTWVGNKRRKMSSKNYVESNSQLPAPMSSSPSRPPDVVPTIRNVPNLPPRSQPPPRTSPSNDLIMTCVYSPNSSTSRSGVSPQTTTTPKTDLLKPSMPRPPARSEADFLKLQQPPQRPASLLKTSMEEKALLLSRQPGGASPVNPLYAKKSFGGSSGQMVDRAAPQKTMSWSIKAVTDLPGGQRSHKPEQPSVSPVPHLSSVQRSRDTPCGLKNLEIREVFSLAATDHPARTLSTEERPRPVESNCFSIAMETGDVDEYTREEELASMAAQNQLCSRFRECNSSPHAENPCALSPASVVRPGNPKILPSNAREAPENAAVYHNNDYYMPLSTSVHNANSAQYPAGNASRNSAHRHYSIHPPQGALLPNQNNYQISGNLSVPWITECSRKRTLQDRTQFSDHDLATLKKYWDNGMTSLGSVCREKIEAVAAELNVDCEIVRTWIGNRRRKYRLMGIEVPPPRGGPATFPEHHDSTLTPTEDPIAGASEESDRHDEVSICLSEESSQADEVVDAGRGEDMVVKEDGSDGLPVLNVKVEAPDEEVGDTVGKLDVEQMRSLLDYKNEEVRYIENELETYKHKYAELQNFTRNLILAVRSNDIEQQQSLVNDPPVELDEMDFSQASPDHDDTSFSMSSVSERNNPDSV